MCRRPTLSATVLPPVVVLVQLLFRVQAKEWLKLMIAPLGGGLEALGRSITPVRGGCSRCTTAGYSAAIAVRQLSVTPADVPITSICSSTMSAMRAGRQHAAASHMNLGFKHSTVLVLGNITCTMQSAHRVCAYNRKFVAVVQVTLAAPRPCGMVMA